MNRRKKMKKFRFDLDRLLAKKLEDQKVILPLSEELNERELATVTGGWGGHHFHHHHRHHHRHHHHW
jgi:bacteriocin-like protein